MLRLTKLISLLSVCLLLPILQVYAQSPTPPATPTKDEIAELLSSVQGLMSTDTACELPCFWSFRPGETTNKEIESFIPDVLKEKLSTGTIPSEEGIQYRSISLSFNTSYPLQSISVIFTFKHDLLSLIHVGLDTPNAWLQQNRFEIANLLNTINFSDVYIASHVSTGSIGLVFISQDKKITVEYSLPLKVEGNVISPLINRPLLLCPNPEAVTYIGIWLQDETIDESFNLHDINPSPPNSTVKFYQPVKWMTGLEADEFISHIIDSPNECIKMLSLPELREKGYGF